MAYKDFLTGFARAQNVENVDVLLRDYAKQYSFQIRSRDRAKLFIDELRSSLDYDFNGKKVLDIGCAYGSFSIELSHIGADVTGIDVSEKWLRLADLNAKDEADVRFMLVDASSRTALEKLGDDRFDLIIMNDVLEHIYDTTGLLHNCRELLTDNGLIYFKVPNGLATSNVLSEGHKKVFGISLLAPDYWQMFITAPFSIYYRRIEFFEALFEHFGLQTLRWITTNRDVNARVTQQKIRDDKARIEHCLAEGFDSSKQREALTSAVQRYFNELDRDLVALEHDELFLKYRATFWEGVLQKTDGISSPNRTIQKESSSVVRRAWRWFDVRLPIVGRFIRRILGGYSRKRN